MKQLWLHPPCETTTTATSVYLGVWTNIPDEVEIEEDVFRTLRDIPSQFPDLPDEEDETL